MQSQMPQVHQQQIPNGAVRSIAVDIILTIITFGIYNLYIQYKQMQTMNVWLNTPKYSFVTWLLLTVITCGLYHIYHEYRFAEDIVQVTKDQQSQLPLVSLVLSCFGLSIVADAIQQAKINSYYGHHAL